MTRNARVSAVWSEPQPLLPVQQLIARETKAERRIPALIADPARYFANKVLVAQQAGATAVIVSNIDGASPPLVSMAAVSGDASASIIIPSVFVSKETGDDLKAYAEGLHVTLSRHFSRAPMLLDGMPMRGLANKDEFSYCALLKSRTP